MKRIAIAVLFVALAAGLPHAGAHGQSATATPTSTASPTPGATPTISASDLINRATQVFASKKTAHFTLHILTLDPGVRQETDQGHGDGSLLDGRNHSYQTAHITRLDKQPPVTKVVRTETITTASVAARRTAHGHWKCTSITGGQGISPANPLPATGQTTYAFANPATTTVNGQLVYDIQPTSGDVTHLLGAGSSAQADIFISMADTTIVRISVNLTTPATIQVQGKPQTVNTTLQLTENLSKYGEPLHITAPRACRGRTSAGATGSVVSWTAALLTAAQRLHSAR